MNFCEAAGFEYIPDFNIGEAPQDLVDYRRGLFQSIGHSYTAQRALVDSVPEESLRLTPADAATASTGWRSILGA